MLDYLLKFNKLPKELQGVVNSPAALKVVEELEKKYQVNLGAIIMRIMVKEVEYGDLPRVLSSEFKLGAVEAVGLVNELDEKLFFSVRKYLGIKKEESGIIRKKVSKKSSKDNLVKYENHLPALQDELENDLKAAYWPIAKSDHKEGFKGGIENHQNLSVKEKDIRASSFFFAPEDEEEIIELTKKLEFVNKERGNDEIEKITDDIIREVDVNFGSEEIVNRFRQIIKTYAKGIRGRVGIKDSLRKPFSAGGMSFDEDSANKVLDKADMVINTFRVLGKIDKPKKMAVLEDRDLLVAGARDVDYDLSALVKNKEEKEKKEAAVDEVKNFEDLEESDSGRGVEGAVEVVKKNSKKKVEVKKVEEKRVEEKKAEPIVSQPVSTVNIRPVVDSFGKKKIEDIKYVPFKPEMPKTMTLIDELRYLDLNNFRRLGQNDALRSVGKIKEKIKLLENENYPKRIEGIKAWRQSPVNGLYLIMCQDSMEKNKSVDIVIAERRASGLEYLNDVEFDMIMDLNRELRF